MVTTNDIPGNLPNSIQELKDLYCSEIDDLVETFFTPCLRHCQKYDRAAGYFSTSALRTWASAVANLVGMPDLRIRLLVSPELQDSDWDALKHAVDPENRALIFEQSSEIFLKRALLWESVSEPTDRDLADWLAWLIAKGRVEIRFAFNLADGQPRGIFHKKIGVFYFPGGEIAAFTGSANETWSAHDVNSESVDVYRSWIDGDVSRIKSKQAEFDRCWNPDPKKLLVRPVSPGLLDQIKDYALTHPPNPSKPKFLPILSNPEIAFEGLWDHQLVACKKFLANSCGILEMATGSGKTRTTIALLQHLLLADKIEGAVITMIGNDLLQQWEHSLRTMLTAKLGLTLVRGFSSYREEERFLLAPKGKVLLCSRNILVSVVKQLRRQSNATQLAIVHDEVHDLGSPKNCIDLLNHGKLFTVRIGLSATPEREYDVDGNAFIENEIGPVVYQYGLDNAIKDNVLCPFNYYTISYRLTPADRADIRAVYARKAAAESAGQFWSNEQLWIQLSKIYKTAREKPNVFSAFLALNPDEKFLDSTIIFVEDKEFAEDIYPVIIRYNHRYSQYFDSDSPDILKKFSCGEIDCLITCHKLSQGIDLPELENVVFFSSQRGKRETIQRLGRCLRIDPNNPNKIAHVIDFRLVGDSGEILLNGQDEDRVAWLTELSKVRSLI